MPRTFAARPALAVASFFALFVLSAAAPHPAVAAGPVYTWPGAPPCDTPAPQDCLAGVPDGATVELATNDPIPATLYVERQVALTAAAGFLPILSDVRITGTGGIVHGLVIHGWVAIVPGQGMTSAKVAENVLLASGQAYGIHVIDSFESNQPPLWISIENNSVHGPDLCVNLMGLASLGAPAQTIVAGNRLDCTNGGVLATNGLEKAEMIVSWNQIVSPFGISFADRDPAVISKPRNLRAEVIGNRVTTSYGSALVVTKDETGGTLELVAQRNFLSGGTHAAYLSDPYSPLLTGELSHNVLAWSSMAPILIIGAPNFHVADNIEFENGP